MLSGRWWHTDETSKGFFANVQYQWINIPEFSSATCQNASSNGCGGFGNNCFYCDICDGLAKLSNSNNNIEQQRQNEVVPKEIAQQLKGLNCPQSPGAYTFRKRFCFNSWDAFDKNKNCQPDFLEGTNSQNNDGGGSLQTAVQIGYGTVFAKVRLAFNASAEVEAKLSTKRAQIEHSAGAEFDVSSSAKTAANDGNIVEERRRAFIAQRQGAWYRNDYLPWLAIQNEFACLRIPFNVCQRPPRQTPEFGIICDS